LGFGGGMAEERPDIVVVLTSQCRAGALGYAGDVNASTPCLDAMAEAAIDLREAVTPHPFGVFARAALLTGRRSPGNGLADYFDSLPEGPCAWAEAFGRLDYFTSFFGKWQLFERDPGAAIVGEAHAKVVVPEGRRGGFAFWEGFEAGHLLNDPYLHGTRLDEPTRFEGYQADVVLGRAADYLDGREGPQAALISIDPPHPPYAAAAGEVEAYDEACIRLLENVPDEAEIRERARRELAGYYAHIEATDAAVGRLVESLRKRGKWERTIFVFTSVHGDMHGSHGVFRKGWPYEESVRVPLLISWPEVLREARRDFTLISLVDLLPTLLGLLGEGREIDGTWDGRDLSPQLRLEAESPERQIISMPSAPPFELQCPYVWEAERDWSRTVVWQEGDDRRGEGWLAPR